MDFEPFDSSGTDDDLPPSHQNRIFRGGRVAVNGRSTPVASVLYPNKMYSENYMETDIRHLEQEAYSSVLKAFKAQADALTWEKEGLLTELRKELRLSNEEHRVLLGRVNADDTIKRIREGGQAGGIQAGVREPIPSPTVSASRKKQKTQTAPHQSFGRSSPPFPSQQSAPYNQSSYTSARVAPMTGPTGKTLNKSGPMVRGASMMKSMQCPSTGPAGRSQIANRSFSGVLVNKPVEGTPYNNPLVGRKVRTRWPDDNNFYEALITDYNATERRHALVYDVGTLNETWEWVNLAEIPPEDIQWEEEDPGIPHRANYFGPNHGIGRSMGHDSAQATGRGRGISNEPPSKEDFPIRQNGVGKKPSEIRLYHTDTLIKEVERVFIINNHDVLETEKAMKALKEQEQALTDAIGSLADISDSESDDGDL